MILENYNSMFFSLSMFSSIHKYEPIETLDYLVKIFNKICDDDDICYLYGGAVRDKLLGLKPIDYDIKISNNLYKSFLSTMIEHDRLLSRETVSMRNNRTNKYKYTHDIVIINAPKQKKVILDFNISNDQTLNDMIDFTVNNLKMPLIGPSQLSIGLICYPNKNTSACIFDCLNDVKNTRLRCIFSKCDISPINVKEYVKWHLDNYENRLKRLHKMKLKEHFRDADVEYLTEFNFNQNITNNTIDNVKEDSCPVCMLEWENIPHNIITFQCRHTFCLVCVNKVLETIKKCPMCKEELVI